MPLLKIWLKQPMDLRLLMPRYSLGVDREGRQYLYAPLNVAWRMLMHRTATLWRPRLCK